MFVEITEQAFRAITEGAKPEKLDNEGTATIELYRAKGVTLKAIVNYYSSPLTQYYIEDINA